MASTALAGSVIGGITGNTSEGVIVAIPESHRDLIDGPYWAALTTVMPDGQPQVTPVWCNREGDYVLTNTMKGFRKEKNMRANPHVTVLVYDPRNPQRNIEVRGRVVALTEEGAIAHNDRLAQLYLGKPDAHFFGDCVPVELAQQYVRIKVVIAPTYVRWATRSLRQAWEPAPGCPRRRGWARTRARARSRLRYRGQRRSSRCPNPIVTCSPGPYTVCSPP
jgi:PPOX class probable F420-dependent enzyme